MNICLSNSTTIFAGGEDYVLILAKHLKLRGHNVYVSSLPGHLLLSKCGDLGIATIPLSYEGMGKVFEVSRQLRRELRSRSINVIHSNANYDRTCAAFATAFGPIKHVASIHSAHSIQHNVTHWMRNKFLTDQFIADAEAVKEVLIEEDSLNPDRITVVPIGVESDSPEYSARARTKTREEWNVSPETIVVGNVARLVPFKGHKHLLQAIAEVTRKREDVIFPIIGDGELLDDLSRQAFDLGISRFVQFLGFRDNLNDLYPAFDIYCHSSLELAAEAFPIAILRALATGLPIVCTKVGGIGAMVEEGVSGFLTPPERPTALANGLLEVIENENLRRSMGVASFQLFQKKFHASAMAEKVERIYLNTLGR